MNRKYLVMTVALILAVAPLLFAQKGAGGKQGGQQRPATGQGVPQAGKPDAQPAQDRDRSQDRDRDRIRATTQQQQEYRTCTQAQERVLERVREMQQAARGSGFRAPEAQQLRDRLRERYSEMEQAHRRLMGGLREDQTEALQDRIRRMERERDRIHFELQDIDVELKAQNIDRDRLRQHARDLEKAIDRWRKQHREMGKQLGLGKES